MGDRPFKPWLLWILLPDGTVRQPRSMEEFVHWATEGELMWYQVALTEVAGRTVSTRFLGIDVSHAWGGLPDRAPVLFETMIFGGDSLPMKRYCTIEEARLGHDEMVLVASQEHNRT